MLTLHNIHTITGGIKKITIHDGKIINISPASQDDEVNNEPNLYFDNALAFPGLINSHDHLDFNLFPRLGNRIYNNYLEWGEDIHKQNKDVIDAVLKIPKSLRTQWGVYKNLLNGITTVYHHGEQGVVEQAVIDVSHDKNSLHSVRLEKNWKWKLNDPLNKKEPYVIHVGEGTDEDSHEEINSLLRWNKLGKKLIGIHGVVMDAEQAKSFEALVWCPDSNLFLLGATAAIDQLKKVTTIVFGTDATVSSDWNVWNQLRIARATGLLRDDELFAAVTSTPAKLRGRNNIGILKDQANADIVIAEKKSDNAMDTFFEINPGTILMIIKNGKVILFDESLLPQLHSQDLNATHCCKLRIDGKFKYVKADVNNLMSQIKNYSNDIFFPVEPA